MESSVSTSESGIDPLMIGLVNDADDERKEQKKRKRKKRKEKTQVEREYANERANRRNEKWESDASEQ